METKKTFVYLYPEADILAHEIGWHSPGYKSSRDAEFLQRVKLAKEETERNNIRKEWKTFTEKEFTEVYGKTLNACIDQRYRQKGFGIYYALLDGDPISDVISLNEGDKLVGVGMDAKTHRTKQEETGEYPYPDQDYILSQVGDPDILRIGGFHMWDCVERLARRAHEEGIDVLVDEDLTEFFGAHIKNPNFRIDKYPNYDPRKLDGEMFKLFMKAREGKPWLWQDYN